MKLPIIHPFSLSVAYFFFLWMQSLNNRRDGKDGWIVCIETIYKIEKVFINFILRHKFYV